MNKPALRDQIAAEAARLLLRGKERDYTAARKRAARWLSRRRISPDNMPTNAEIQVQIYALGGLFAEERELQTLIRMRDAAVPLMQALQDFAPRLTGSALHGPVTEGAEITLILQVDSADDVLQTLEQAGYRAVLAPPDPNDPALRIRLRTEFPCELRLASGAEPADGLTLDELLELNSRTETLPDEVESEVDDESYHPDAFAVMQMLLERLERVQLDPERHPEGDALYHSLQVFELGREERPYDEEFLLACLLHDVGLGINRRLPVVAAIESLGSLITERTRFLIEHRAEAVEYLRTGRLPRSIRRSENFDDLILLAKCDLAGRVRGAQVGTAEEALNYIAGLSSAWDEV